jgi:hypothetical protein
LHPRRGAGSTYLGPRLNPWSMAAAQAPPGVARTWLRIKVDLLGAGGITCDPAPGRIFIVGPSHWQHPSLFGLTSEDRHEPIDPATLVLG